MSGIALASLPTGSVAGEIQGQVIIKTTGGEIVKLGVVQVFAYNRAEVDEAIKKVDAKLKGNREAARVISQQFDDLLKRASVTTTKNQNFYFDLVGVQRLFQERNNYLLSSQPYFAALDRKSTRLNPVTVRSRMPSS